MKGKTTTHKNARSRGAKKSQAKSTTARRTLQGQANIETAKKSDRTKLARPDVSKKKSDVRRGEKNSTKVTKSTAASSRQTNRSPVAILPSKTLVAIVQSTDGDKDSLLESALSQSGFWIHLDEALLRAKVDRNDFRVLIKPDLSLFDGGSTGTDPQLVEHLIDLLTGKGFNRIAVGSARNSFDLWLENRDALVLADMVGYRFITAGGHQYDVVDLGEDIVEVPFQKGGALQDTGLSRWWVEAHYRICFAKNKTDEEYFYGLCLQSLLDVLPKRDKDYHYRYRLKPWDVCVDILKQTPAHFSVIDAFVSNHGGAGSREARPLPTQTIIASKDLLLADWAAANKMGLDPFTSPINARALEEIGLPAGYSIVGDLRPYEGWINVHPLMADSVRKRNEWPELGRIMRPWMQSVNTELFPFKNPINERVNSILSRYLSNVDENPAAFWTVIGLNYWLGAVNDGLEAFRTLYDKDRLRWNEAPLNIDLSVHPLSEYEAIVDYLEPFAELVRHIPADANGLRWRYLDKSILFEFSRVIPAPYEEFVARVDISKTIQLMNDYIGGVAVPVVRDYHGRVTHQAERNLYLTQPNYLVLYQGKVIDVTKLEYIRYRDRDQTIFWKTIKSENQSATFDDGIVTFAATTTGETQVVVAGRQQFALPLFWQAVNLDLNPQIKDFLVTHAYTTFFTQTLANFEATYEGREIRIGRPWDPEQGEPDSDTRRNSPAERISEVVSRVSEVVNRNFQSVSSILPLRLKPKVSRADHVDEDGFAHFKTPTENGDGPDARSAFKKTTAEARGFMKGLTKAIQKDWGIRRDDD